MYDKVIKAYLAGFDSNLRIPYLEKKSTIDDLTIIASIYKSREANSFYCLAVIVQNGEYIFSDGQRFSKYYSADEIMSRDVAQDVISELTKVIMFRKRLLAFIGNNPKLPSILSVAFNGTFLIYYEYQGKLRLAKLMGDTIVINLPAKEQVYFTDLMQEFQIKVSRIYEEGPVNYDRLY